MQREIIKPLEIKKPSQEITIKTKVLADKENSREHTIKFNIVVEAQGRGGKIKGKRG